MPSLVVLTLLLALGQESASIKQKSSGPCTVNNALVSGNVRIIINCPGIDPRAMRPFNEQLQRQGNLLQKLSEELEAAEEWRRKYEELLERRASVGASSPSSLRVDFLIREGRLQEAEKLLDEMINEGEKEIDGLAQNYLSRGRLRDLQLRSSAALEDYQMAYRYRANDIDVSIPYAKSLLELGHPSRALAVLEPALKSLRKPTSDSQDANEQMANLLNLLTRVYLRLGRFTKAEESEREAIKLHRLLSNTSGTSNDAELAEMLHYWGVVCGDSGRFEEAKEAFQQSLTIFRRLATKDPGAYEPRVAFELNSLGGVYSRMRRQKDAEMSYTEALKVCSGMKSREPGISELYLAMALEEIAYFYELSGKAEQAEEHYKEALKVCRGLVKARPGGDIEPTLARVLNNLGNLYKETKRPELAEPMYREALTICRHITSSSSGYESETSGLLDKIAGFFAYTGRFAEAETVYLEALDLEHKYQSEESEGYEGVGLIQTTTHLAILYYLEQRPKKAEETYKKALEECRSEEAAHPSEVYQSWMGGTWLELAKFYDSTPIGATDSDPPNPSEVPRPRPVDVRGRTQEALQAREEALKVFRGLAKNDKPKWEPTLAQLLLSIGDRYVDTHQPQKARPYVKEALDIYQRLSNIDPEKYRDQVFLAKMLAVLVYPPIDAAEKR